MITEKDCKMLVGCFCEALKSDIELQDVMAKAMLRGSKQKEHLISLSQAASILGVSKSLLYQSPGLVTSKNTSAFAELPAVSKRSNNMDNNPFSIFFITVQPFIE